MTSDGWNARGISNYTSSERTPLLGNRQDTHGILTTTETTKVMFVSILLLGLILIGGASAGIYLLSIRSNGK